MNQGNLNKVQQRAIQYWFIDGWVEIAMALMSALLAVYFRMIDYTHNSRAAYLILTLIIFAATAVLSGFVSLILLAFGLLTHRSYLSDNPQNPEA